MQKHFEQFLANIYQDTCNNEKMINLEHAQIDTHIAYIDVYM